MTIVLFWLLNFFFTTRMCFQSQVYGIPVFPDSKIKYKAYCPRDFFYHQKANYCYFKASRGYGYLEARKHCQTVVHNRDVSLASIKDKTLIDTFYKNQRFFLGITDVVEDGHFVWENGKDYEGYYPWDNFLDCGYYSPESKWLLLTCYTRNKYLCQAEKKRDMLCDGKYFYHDNTRKCYKISEVSATYSRAIHHCRGDHAGSQLSTLRDPDLLQHIIGHSDHFFVGISDRWDEGKYKEANNHDFKGTPPWYEDRRCKSYYYPHGWDRVNCNNEMRYICQSQRDENFYCPSDFTYQNSTNKCYRVSNDSKEYFDARKDCQHYNGHLASIHQKSDRNDIGDKNLSIEWILVDKYSEKNVLDKDQNCTVRKNGLLEYRDCNERHSYTCETEPQYCPDSYSLNSKLNACYYFSKDLKTYFDARDACVSNAPHESSVLVNVADEKVKSYIEGFVDYPVFVGATDLDKRGEFVWESDGRTDQLHWENDLDCGLYGKNGHDVSTCDENHAFVCEYQPKFCPDDYFEFSNTSSCYQLSKNLLNYTEARNSCPKTVTSAYRATLASVTNNATKDLIERDLHEPMYFGLNDLSKEDHPEWDFGDKYDKIQVSLWDDTYDCVYYNGKTYGIDICSRPKLYGCEAEPSLTVEHQDFCLPQYFYFEESNTCYYISKQGKTYEKAREYCQSRNPLRGSSLASLNKDELLKIVSNKVSSKGFFIGLSDLKTRSKYEWENGKQHEDFPSWITGEMNQDPDCVLATKENNRIRGNCQESNLFLCETIPAYCPFGFFYYEAMDTCLFYSSKYLDYSHAKNRCRSMSPRKGSHMVVVTNRTMNHLLFDMAGEEDFYIGLSSGFQNILTWDNGDEYDPDLSRQFLSSPGLDQTNDKKCFGSNPSKPVTYYTWSIWDCSTELRFFCQVEPNYPQLPPTPPWVVASKDESEGVFYNDEVTPPSPIGTIPDVHIGITFRTPDFTLGP